MKKLMQMVAVASMVFMGSMGVLAGDQGTLPEGLHGFSGQVRGVVVEKGKKQGVR